MAEFTKTETVNCPYCEDDHVVKNGSYRECVQRYLCRGCKKQFSSTGVMHGRHIAPERIGAAIRMFYSGMSYKQIAETMADMYDMPEPDKATIYHWVKTYTDTAVKEMEKHPAHTGGDWVADEMMLDVGGQKYWNWNVMDAKTRYILASHLSKERTAAAAKTVMRKALKSADTPPKSITTDKLRSYLSAIKEVLPDATHIQSEGIRAEVNNNLSERLQGTYRQRTKTLRRLDSKESGQRYLDGWVLTYNLFRDHEGLGGQKPGDRAKVTQPFKEWEDVARISTGPGPKRRKKGSTSAGAATPARSKSRPEVKKPEVTLPRRRRARKRLAVPKPVYPKLSRKSIKST